MRKVMALVAMGLVVTSAGCVETMGSGYPTTYGYGSGYPATYGYGSSGYGYNSQPTYYAPSPQAVTRQCSGTPSAAGTTRAETMVVSAVARLGTPAQVIAGLAGAAP
jgi:hypothetical protein